MASQEVLKTRADLTVTSPLFHFLLLEYLHLAAATAATAIAEPS